MQEGIDIMKWFSQLKLNILKYKEQIRVNMDKLGETIFKDLEALEPNKLSKKERIKSLIYIIRIEEGKKFLIDKFEEMYALYSDPTSKISIGRLHEELNDLSMKRRILEEKLNIF